MGAFFILGSSITKKQVLAMGGSKTTAALLGGTVGGVAQAIVMTPAGMIFTSLNVNRGKKGYENDNAFTVARRIIKKEGIKGLFYGGGPMCIRQASNWASRAGFTEICRTNLRMSQYGVWGEIGSGVIGGVGSCWNTRKAFVSMVASIFLNLHRRCTLDLKALPVTQCCSHNFFYNLSFSLFPHTHTYARTHTKLLKPSVC